jgi:hypothetical protein
MKVAQRAYLSIDNSQLELRLLEHHDSLESDKITGISGLMMHSFVINNIGHTPASIGDLTVTYEISEHQLLNPQQGFRPIEIPRPNSHRIRMANYLAQGGQKSIEASEFLVFPDGMSQQYVQWVKELPSSHRDITIPYYLPVYYSLAFVDVFGDSGAVNWSSDAETIRRQPAPALPAVPALKK